MDHNDAYAAAGVLVGACPGPWTDDVIDVWADAFARLNEPRTLLHCVQRFALNWTGQYRPALGEVIQAYEEAVQFQRRRALPSSASVHCDGSGWIGTGAGYRPCKRCNPAAAAVFADADKLERWRSGERIVELDVGVEKGKAGAAKWVGGAPPQCSPAVDGQALTLPPAVGVGVARDAYEVECAAAGREPNVRHFSAALGVRS